MMRGSIKPLLIQLDKEKGVVCDHTALLADAELTKRPEQLNFHDFVALTNREEEEFV